MERCKRTLSKISLSTANFTSNTNEAKNIYSHSILNDYNITFNEMVGAGFSGFIYICTSISDNSRFALKVLPDNKDSTREISLHLKCHSSQHIVEIHRIYKNYGIHPGAVARRKYLYVVMELIEGNSLRCFMEKMKVVDENLARRIMRQIILSLKSIHAQGIIHRDIKPENILLQNENPNRLVLKTCDFGFSVTEKSRPTSVYYSPRFVAPEVICKAKKFNLTPSMKEAAPYDHRCDIWALGIILYLLLIGDYPFYSELNGIFLTPLMYSSIIEANYIIPRDYNTHISVEAKNLIQCLLKADPGSRLTLDKALAHPWFLNQTMHKNSNNLMELF